MVSVLCCRCGGYEGLASAVGGQMGSSASWWRPQRKRVVQWWLWVEDVATYEEGRDPSSRFATSCSHTHQ